MALSNEEISTNKKKPVAASSLPFSVVEKKENYIDTYLYTNGYAFRTEPSDNPNDGPLDIEQFLKTNQLFKRSIPSVIKPKVLMLNDWLLSGWNEAKCRLFVEKTETLLEKGFEIYFINPNLELVRIDLGRLNTFFLYHFKFRRAFTGISETSLSKIMQERGYTRDQWYQLDNHAINCLLADKVLEKKVYLSEIAHSNRELENVMERLKKQKVVEVIYDQIDEKTLNALSFIKENAYSVKLSSIPTVLQKSLCHKSCVVKCEEHSNITTVINSKTINFASRWIGNELVIRDVNVNFIIQTYRKEFDNLLSCTKHLNFTNIELSSHELEYIHSKTNNLNTLTINDCMRFETDTRSFKLLEQLEVLCITKSFVTSSTIFRLLEATTSNLRKLNLENVWLDFYDLLIALKGKTELKCMTIKNSKAFKIFPILADTEEAVADALSAMSFPKLEYLCLQGFEIEKTVFYDFLVASPTLRILEGNNIIFSEDKVDSKSTLLNHSSLESISFYDIQPFETDIIDRLIHISPGLKELRVPEYKHGKPLTTCSPYVDANVMPKKNAFIHELREIFEPLPNSHSLTPISMISSRATNVDASVMPKKNASICKLRTIFESHPKSHVEPPVPMFYRLCCYTQLKFHESICSEKNAFILSAPNIKHEVIELSASDNLNELFNEAFEKSSDAEVYCGHYALTLSDTWQELPSLSANETLLAYQVSHNTHVNLSYSKQTDLYYIKSADKADLGKAIIIDYIISVPHDLTEPPTEIDLIIRKYRKFGVANQPLKVAEPTGRNYLKAINESRTGACRHRAVAFMNNIHIDHPNVSVRIVGNDGHAFVETLHDNTWVIHNLGGYPEKSELLKLEKNVDLQEAAKIETNTDLKSQAQTDNVTNFLEIKYSIDDTNFLKYYHPKRSTDYHSFDAFMATLQKPRHLIETRTTEALLNFSLALQVSANNHHRPYIYIHSPKDLCCPNPHIRREGDRGVFTTGPGGPLYEFLTQEHKMPPLIIVNYNNFSANDIARYNQLIDDEGRNIHGIPLAPNTQIIGLRVPDTPSSYHGSDFTSRFDSIESSPFFSNDLNLPSLPWSQTHDPQGSSSKNTAIAIELYHDPYWRSQLLGHWEIHGDHLQFVEGELITALKKSPQEIILRNAPWHDPDFVYFWRQAVSLGYITSNGYPWPVNISIRNESGYLWESLAHTIKLYQDVEALTVPNNVFVLNPSTFQQLFSRYEYDEQHHYLIVKAGYLVNDNPYFFYVTRELNEHQWARILSSHGAANVTVMLAPGIKLPLTLLKAISNDSKHVVNAAVSNHTSAFFFLKTNDSDALVYQLLKRLASKYIESPLVINIDELNSSNLFTKLVPRIKKDQAHFQFDKEIKVVERALQKNKVVILVGKPSVTLKDTLIQYWMQRQRNPEPKGTLWCISDETFHGFPMKKTTYAFEHRLKILSDKHPNWPITIIKQIEKEASPLDGLVHLETRGNYLVQQQSLLSATVSSSAQPNQNCPTKIKHSNTLWEGLQAISSIQQHDEVLIQSLQNAELDAIHFLENRHKKLNEALERSPIVFICGITGVGKTFFVHEYARQNDIQLYESEKRITHWAHHQGNQRAILFIDRANIGTRQWSEFEGLFQNPRHIITDGEYYSLTHQHQVIFAGNPTNDNRQIASLFERHGNTVIFEQLPITFLYQHILRPIFRDSRLASKTAAICIEFLKVYHFLSNYSVDRVLITARQLQMMALLTCSYEKQNLFEDIINVARYYSYMLATVPESLQAVFDQHFRSSLSPIKPIRDIPKAYPSEGKNISYIITDSRHLVIRAIDDFLSLRSNRNHHTNVKGGVQYCPGLGGLIIEGEPGIGKSQLALRHLASHGYVKIDIADKISAEQLEKGHYYYHLPMSLPIAQKETLLRKAFNEGALVFVDEINTGPSLEWLLNTLLTGKTPEGGLPARPGFMILATQNAISMSGRQKFSQVVENRTMKIVLPDYSLKEATMILKKQGLPEDLAQKLFTSYSTVRRTAVLANASHIPCFRELLKAAKKIIQEYEFSINPPIASSSMTSIPEEPHHGEENLNSLIDELNEFSFFKREPVNDRFMPEGNKRALSTPVSIPPGKKKR